MQALDKQTQNQTKALEQTLEQAKEELRDAYMSFKDLQTRCVIDIRRGTRTQEENPVYYFKPETFLLDEPEKQKVYRQQMLSKIGNVPKPPPIQYLGDELHRSMAQSVADQSNPKLAKQNLCEFFKRRQYQLQHMKYKMLCRWAHHNLTQETSENIGIQATFMYGKLEYSLEQSVLRIERLQAEDFYEPADGFSRPTTQPQGEGCSLYVEKFDLKPQSLLREDDIEVYMRSVAHKSKLNKVQTKFQSRLKWLAVLKKYEIYEASVQDYFKLKQSNIDRQSKFLANSKQRAMQSQIMTPKLTQEVDAIFDRTYCVQYEKQFSCLNDRTLHFWKPNHDEVPPLIQDQFSLRQKIVEIASYFNLHGDIELDQGFSFSYQVSVFFPPNLQKQILKSQFSIYDSHDDDPNNQMKRTFNQMAKFDINIFKDISINKHAVPTEEAFQQEIKDQDIKVLRMKSSEYWLCYCVLEPSEPEWHHKQQAILNQTSIDSLVLNGFNFIDVNDLATINRINEDNIQLHLKVVAKTLQFNPDSQVVKVSVATPDGDKQIDAHTMKEKTSHVGMVEAHLLAAVSQPQQTAPPQPKLEVAIPGHLLTTYFTLRFMKSKDAKTKLLYALNYFRAIQRRLALDLREFGTRDRINSQFANPFVPSQEANQTAINKINQSVNAFEKVQRNSSAPEWKLNTKMSVFSTESLLKIRNMASVRQYKQNGLFNHKALSTCPAFPRFHVANGEPLSRTEDTSNVMGKALKLMGRVQTVELNEPLQEVYIKDDYGIYVIYDCVLQDMKYFEIELSKICSHYLHKSEILRDPTELASERPFPTRDRLEILKDILVFEAEFNFKKVLLCQVYMECYEHVSDPLDQQKLMQVVTDIMARRPRLNLDAHYFTDAYKAEIECLSKQFELVKALVDLQVSVEKTENKRLQESIGLSYKMADEYASNKWKYQDAETLLQSVVGTKYEEESPPQPKVSDVKKTKGGLWNEDESSVSDDQCYQEEKDKFSRLLGLEQISLESIYLGYQQKDVNILKIMSEHSHFVQCHEGYPEFLQYTHKQLGQLQRYNPWSQPMGSLDFYETLDFIIKFQQVTMTAQQELNQTLTPWDNTLATIIDTQFATLSLLEFRRVLQIQEGRLIEYEGREVVEDESVLGNADRMIFYAKELIADLASKPKALLDPFIVSKLDLETIKYFDFQQLPTELNKYTLRNKGIQGYDYLIKVEKATMEGIAKNMLSQGEIEKMLQGKVGDAMNLRNVIVPSMLQVYCNMAEVHRLRAELIVATAETSILSEIYLQQAAVVGQKSMKLVQSEGISFQVNEPNKFVNYVDDGPGHQTVIDIAIREFDPALLSNLNFRNADSFKLCVLTSGLEELRAVLQYQIMQKHLLVVATRINQKVIDSHQRAQAELNLITLKLVVPNSVICCAKIMNKNQDSINQTQLKSERNSYKLSLSSNCLPVFYNITNKKQTLKAQTSKEFFQYHTQVVKQYPHHEHIVNRVMRSYKLKLASRLVQAIQTEVYLDAQKVMALQACQQLRVFNRFFQFDSNLGFKYETAPLLENFNQHYTPRQFQDQQQNSFNATKKQDIVKVIENQAIVSYLGIPSSLSLLMAESAPIAQLRKYKRADPDFDLKQDLESQLKARLPQEDSSYFESSYARLITYYVQLSQVAQQEWFQQKLKLTMLEQAQIEHCIDTGLQYWTRDQFDQRQQQVTTDNPAKETLMSHEYLHAQVETLKSKQNVKQVMSNLWLTIHSLIQQHEKNKDYLQQYREFRFQTIAGSLHRLANSFMLQDNLNGYNACRQGIKDFSNTQHFKVNYLQPNNYSVFSCVLDSELEPSQFTFGRYLEQDIVCFKRCVQPVINEQALEPAQITLFQSLFQQDSLKKVSLFAGQLQQPQFQSLQWVLLGLSPDDRIYANSFFGQARNQTNDFMETVFNDSSMAKLTSEEAYSMEQLMDAKKFINEQTQALLFKNALSCWVENQPYPESIETFKRFEDNFKQKFFWKQMMQKEELQKKHSFIQIPSQSELNILKKRIDDLANDHSLPSDFERQKRDQLVAALKEEFFLLKKKVTLDNYYNLKAQIHVFSNEIEKLMIQASVSALTSEVCALSKCFTLQVPSIQYHIHPFQQFAATIFDQVDPNLHLDVVNKISNVQVMLTKLRNRSTEVETLTSGPGMVFTVKDFNDIFNEFCRSTIKSQEIQFKSRTDTQYQMQESYRELLYTKDMQIKTLKQRLAVIGTNLESIIDARLFEKGNQLIYELDSSKRVLSIFKAQFKGLEQHLLTKILGEQLQKFQRQAIVNDINRVKFGQYKEAIQTMINQDWEQNAAEIKVLLKQKADYAKITDNDAKRIPMYHSSVLPPGFKHYSSCSCYEPNPEHPRPTLELAQMEMLSEREAREELCKMCDLNRKQRILFKTKEMLIRSKYQDEINLLKKQLNSNKSLWDQLSESQKREKVVCQELLFTQQQLSSSEKQILALKDEVKQIDMEKARLLNFKTTQYERLKELEIKVKQSDMDSKLDTDKIIQKLIQSTQLNNDLEKQLKTVQHQQAFLDTKSGAQIGSLQRQILREQQSKVQMGDKIEQMKMEIKMMETTQNDALQLHWKQKCLEVFDVCQGLKQENDSLRSKCQDLIQKGISLAESVQRSDSRQQSTKVSDKQMYSTTTSIKQHLNTSLRIPQLNPLKAPSTQNGHRNDYQKNDIRHVLSSVPKRLQSVDQPLSQQIKQRKYIQDQYGFTQKSLQFDVQGTTISSPRTKQLQSRKQPRHLIEDSIIM